ncbi:hypothetical protein [Desulfogranum mediterraneum]|uniref:hypothetical protein n=1 Tax=Desulfogranum mediterraneum TaxID=160661 RepID=UPI0004011A22|nr:hypothetical protein [Desulfogranum mediterraneum]
MEFLNFSEAEIETTRKALAFISKDELDLAVIPSDLPVIKTENYLTECEQFLDPERTIGTENLWATIVFPNSRTSRHKLLVNKEKITGLGYVHSLTNELVHLSNFSKFFKDNGHLYTFNQEKMLERHYHEFLLWAKFQAKRISIRTYTLMMWHQANGDAPPADGRYQFSEITLSNHGVERCLQELAACDNVAALRDGYWDLLGVLALYLGELGFYQKEAEPSRIDDQFPAEALDRWLGLENVLGFYRVLQKTPHYGLWPENKRALRRLIITMESHCKEAFKEAASA